MLEKLLELDRLLKSIGNPELEDEIGDAIIDILVELGVEEKLRGNLEE